MAVSIGGESLGQLLGCVYDATGLQTVTITENLLLAWAIDENNPINPTPVTIGALPPAPPNSGSVISPRWAVWQSIPPFSLVASPGLVYTSSGWIGPFDDFLTWLATNNGASRKLLGTFARPTLINAWSEWARNNPDLC